MRGGAFFNGKEGRDDFRKPFTHFIRDRYNLSCNVIDWIHETNDDIKPLEKLKEKVDVVIKNEKYIRKAAFMNLSKSLDGAIKRCKGDMHAKPF